MHILGGFTKEGKFLKKTEASFSKERQRVEVGGAIWFLLLYSKDKLKWFQYELSHTKNNVSPFGIYVTGHSHSADLAKISFIPTFTVKKMKKKEEEKEKKRKEEEVVKEKKRKEEEMEKEKKRKKEEEKERKASPYKYKVKVRADEESRKYQAYVAGDITEELDWLKRKD